MAEAAARRGRTTGDFFLGARPRVIAHRGLAIDAPENTMLAFVSALSIGVTHLETDVHASRDGVAVVAHDADLLRLTGRAIRVADLTLAELEKIDLGHGQGFSSLESVLAAFPEAFVNIDIKSADAVDPTVAAIIAARAIGRVLITSFSERRRRAAVARLDGVATSASSGTVLLAVIAARIAPTALLSRLLRRIDALQVPERWGPVTIVTPRTVRRWHAAGVEVHVWTVNEVDDMTRLIGWGVDGIVTDRAERALALIDSH